MGSAIVATVVAPAFEFGHQVLVSGLSLTACADDNMLRSFFALNLLGEEGDEEVQIVRGPSEGCAAEATAEPEARVAAACE